MGNGRSAALRLASREAGAVLIVPSMMPMLTGEEDGPSAGRQSVMSFFKCRSCGDRGKRTVCAVLRPFDCITRVVRVLCVELLLLTKERTGVGVIVSLMTGWTLV